MHGRSNIPYQAFLLIQHLTTAFLHFRAPKARRCKVNAIEKSLLNNTRLCKSCKALTCIALKANTSKIL